MKIIYFNLEIEKNILPKDYIEFYDYIDKNFTENDCFKIQYINFKIISEIRLYHKNFNINYGVTIDFRMIKYSEFNLQNYLEDRFYIFVLPFLKSKDDENRLDYC